MVYRTVPATLSLKPNTEYRISCDYLCDTTNCFEFVAGTDALEEPFKKTLFSDGSWNVKKLTMTIKTPNSSDTFIGLSKLEQKRRGTIVIDNLLVEEL